MVAHGTPDQVAGNEGSYTGRFLAELVTPRGAKKAKRPPQPKVAAAA